jgi:hypothetical protein
MMDTNERLRVADAVVKTISQLYPPDGEGIGLIPIAEVTFALVDVLCFYVALLPEGGFPDADVLAENLKLKLDWLRQDPSRNPLPIAATGRLISGEH